MTIREELEQLVLLHDLNGGSSSELVDEILDVLADVIQTRDEGDVTIGEIKSGNI